MTQLNLCGQYAHVLIIREGKYAMTIKEMGETVRAIRQKLGMSTTELAKHVGISQAQISRLENGLQGFRSETAFRISKALKVPVFRLFMNDAEWKKWSKKR